MRACGLTLTAAALLLCAGWPAGAVGPEHAMLEVRRPLQAPQPVDRHVVVDGLRLHYLDWGTPGRQPFILLHGLDRSARSFDHVARHFADRYHVIALDLRGHGESAWDPQGRYGVEDYTRDLAALLRQLGLRDVVVWGNSTGGRVAQALAGLHPDLVAAGIAEDVGPERPVQIADGYRRRVRERTVPGAPRPATDPRVADGFVPIDLWPIVGRITAPVLYVVGERSTIVSPATLDRLQKTLPRVQIATILGAGHYPSEDDPAAFLAVVDRFLAGLRTAGPPRAEELARYRLTPAGFEAFTRASRRLAEAMAADPRFASAPLFTHDLVVAGDVEESSRTLEVRLQADPPLRAALDDAGVAPREYTVFSMALVAAWLAHGFVKAGVLPGVPAGVAADNVAFVERHEAAVAAVLARLGIL